LIHPSILLASPPPPPPTLVGNAAGNPASTFARPEPVRDTVEQEIDEIFE
jgi:hypothetical protein